MNVNILAVLKKHEMNHALKEIETIFFIIKGQKNNR